MADGNTHAFPKLLLAIFLRIFIHWTLIDFRQTTKNRNSWISHTKMSVNDCCFIVGVRQTDLEAMALSRGVGWVLTQNRHENDECV
jgi:hypothetical protein